MTLAQLAFNALLGVSLFYIVNRAGDLARPIGYTDFISVYKTNAFGLNVAFRAFAPTIAVGLVAVLLYGVHLGVLVQNIWLAVVFYWLYRFSYYLIRGWLPILPTGTLFAQVVVSSAATSYFYTFMISTGPDNLVPDVKDVTFQFWLMVIGFAYALLQARQPAEDGSNPPLRALVLRYRAFLTRYSHLLNSRFSQDLVLQNLLFTVMVMEDFNRSSIVRQIERLLVPVRKARTTGIMQFTSPDRALSDEESILLAQDYVAELFDDWYSEWLTDTENEPIISLRSENPLTYSYEYNDLTWRVPATEFYETYSGNALDHTEDVYSAIAEDTSSRLRMGVGSLVNVTLIEPQISSQELA